MNKKVILLLSAVLLIGSASYAVPGPFGYDLQKDINRSKSAPKSWEVDEQQKNQNNASNNKNNESSSETPEASVFLDKYSTNPGYYTNPTLKSVKARYNQGNYTGALQELYALLKKEPSNSEAYYYLAMVYTKLGETEAANSCYEKVINSNDNDDLVGYAKKGKACLNNEPACYQDDAADKLQNATNSLGQITGEMDDLDKFINSPFGNGFSQELNDQLRNKQLQNLQNKMNRGEPLSEQDLKKLQEYNNKTEANTTDKLAMANDMPSNDEIINAVQVLKRAGLNISTEMPETSEATNVSTTVQTPAVQPANYYTPDPQIQQMSMLLNNGNSYNSDPMMNMLPYMMQNEGKNINPQVIQAMMMNSMMNSLNGLNNTNNN